MDMAHAYNEIEIADVSGAKAKLEELIARDLASSEEFNINLDDEYLEIEVYAPWTSSIMSRNALQSLPRSSRKARPSPSMLT